MARVDWCGPVFALAGPYTGLIFVWLGLVGFLLANAVLACIPVYFGVEPVVPVAHDLGELDPASFVMALVAAFCRLCNGPLFSLPA